MLARCSVLLLLSTSSGLTFTPPALSLKDKVSVSIISSPSPLHPSTAQIWRVIDSLKLFGLEDAKLHIVCDGVRTRPTVDDIKGKDKHDYAMSKLGVVTEQAARTYDAYIVKLQSELDARFTSSPTPTPYLLERLPEQSGFAFAVKHALESPFSAGRPLQLVCQHDREFVLAVDMAAIVSHLLSEDESAQHIRYLGFPTFKSRRLVQEYRWPVAPRHQSVVGSRSIGDTPDMMMRPAPFWYDSNHLACKQRYLEIFTPFLSLPLSTLQRLGKAKVGKMVIRRGDFIEDRFGQAQRGVYNELLEQLEQETSPDAQQSISQFTLEMISWFGCYELDLGPQVAVSHLGGRKYSGPNRTTTNTPTASAAAGASAT